MVSVVVLCCVLVCCVCCFVSVCCFVVFEVCNRFAHSAGPGRPFKVTGQSVDRNSGVQEDMEFALAAVGRGWVPVRPLGGLLGASWTLPKKH